VRGATRCELVEEECQLEAMRARSVEVPLAVTGSKNRVPDGFGEVIDGS
jgi:hypothetical protein